jgi:hypothetical protein
MGDLLERVAREETKTLLEYKRIMNTCQEEEKTSRQILPVICATDGE